MRRLINFWMCALLGCAGPRTGVQLYIDPVDLTTAHADGTVTIKTIPARAPESIEAVKKQVFLRALDGGADLPIAIEDVASSGQTSESAFLVRPSATLENRWHVLGFHSLPEIFDQNGSRLSDGFRATRFHPASAPTIREVWSCLKAGRSLVDVYLSEPVVLDAVPQDLEVTLGGERCSLDVESSGDMKTLRHWCNATKLADVEIIVHEGLKGTAGGDFQLLGGERAASLSMTLSAGESVHEDCRRWMPQP
jgi:hypothetical protein